MPNPPKPIILTDPEIHAIAGDLDCGLRVFIDRKTNKIISFPEELENFGPMGDLEETWRDIKKRPQNYFEIEKPDGNDSFSLMEDFLEEIPDANFKTRLAKILQKPKPFRNFKNTVDNNSDYRQKWFAFKKQKMTVWVKEQLENYNVRHHGNAPG